MWRHLVAVAAALAVTLVILNFWGNFGGAMTHFVKLRGQQDGGQRADADRRPGRAAMRACAKKAPCPQVPDSDPDSTP